MASALPGDIPAFFTMPAAGELGRSIAERDWSASPLGHPAQWSPLLRNTVALVLPAKAQIVMFWGENYCALYNDAYAPTIGDKHPRALGRPGSENWSELWPDLEPLLARVRLKGETVFAKDRPFYIERHGFGENVYFDISYSPVSREDGHIEGVLCIVSETTERVRAERDLLADRERLAQMFQTSPGFMALLRGPTHVFELTNAAYQRLIGHRDVVGKPIRSALPDIAGQGFFELLDQVYRTGEPYTGRAAKVLITRNEGAPPEECWLDFVYQPVKDTDGNVSGIFIEGTDVTAHYRTIEARQQESHALEILNLTAARISAELNLDALVQTVVDAGVELTGAQFGAFFYNVTDAQGESYMLYALSGAERSAFANFPMPRNTQVFAPTFEGQGPVRSDDITADPRYGKNAPRKGMPEGHLPVRSYLAVPVVSRSGEVIGGLFFGHGQMGMFTERAERLMVGLAAQAATGIDNARLFQRTQRMNETLELEVEQRTAERDRLWTTSEDLLTAADLTGRLLRVSPSWLRLLGREEGVLLASRHSDLAHPDDRATLSSNLDSLAETGRPVSFESRLQAADGLWRWISWTFAREVDGQTMHGVGRDVTDAKVKAAELVEIEERLRQAQKMETVGQLTGGIAHDFNNLLQVISGNLETLLRNLPSEQARLRRSADNAMNGAQRAATLTQRLLAFSRRQPLSPKPTDANRLVASMSELLHRSLGETIDIEAVLASSLWRIEVDPNQLENALLNLALNARDAMPEGGKLTIETANTHLDHAYVAQNTEVLPGQYVMICVSDTGTGMDADVLHRAFEPFFTTKEIGQGTGLGLSMVYGFVKQSGGHVKIYSETANGTTVRIYLPRLLNAADVPEQPTSQIAPEGEPDETILVCEDDDDVRAYSIEQLRELGYRVLEAHDGPSALRVLEQQNVDLLFTDVVLPGGMTGAVLAQRAWQIRPDLKVLFTTGYARNAIVHHGRLDPGVELLTKPFSYSDLAARVRDLLDAPPAAK